MLTALMKNRIVIASVALCAGFVLAYLVLPQPVSTSAEAIEALQDDIGVTIGVAQDGVYMVVEDMPELVGEFKTLMQDIQYPEIARKASVEGRVIVQFVVNEQGNVEDVVVTRGIGAGCDEEAVRVVSEAKFTPGMQDGKAVPVRMTLPITFKLA